MNFPSLDSEKWNLPSVPSSVDFPAVFFLLPFADLAERFKFHPGLGSIPIF